MNVMTPEKWQRLKNALRERMLKELWKKMMKGEGRLNALLTGYLRLQFRCRASEASCCEQSRSSLAPGATG